MMDDHPPSSFVIPQTEGERDARWLANVIAALSDYASEAHCPKVMSLLDAAHTAARTAAGLPNGGGLH